MSTDTDEIEEEDGDEVVFAESQQEADERAAVTEDIDEVLAFLSSIYTYNSCINEAISA